jgi:hypothetical protein
MNLYHWTSAALKNYSNGDLVVVAETVEEARVIIRSAALAIYLTQISWFDEKDEDDVERYAEFVAELAADLAKDPTIAPGFVAIWGGE